MKTRTIFFRIFLYGVLVLLPFFMGVAHAQIRVNQLVQETFTTTFSSIKGQVGTTTLSTLTTSNISGYTTISMPFAFTYDGSAYSSGTTLYVNQAGSVNFGSYYSTYVNKVYPSSTAYPNTIGPLSGLQYVYGGVHYQVSGISPNRVLTIEWSQAVPYTYASTNSVDYQVKLYEAGSMIEFHYSKYNFSMLWSTSYRHGVGINGKTSPSFAQNLHFNSSTNSYTPAANVRFRKLPNIQLSVSPKAMDFGPQFTGVATQGVAIATHAGTESVLNLISASISGPHASDFQILSGPTPSNTVDIAGTSTYAIQFLPTYGGPRTATLTIVSNGLDSAVQTVTLTGFGIAPKINIVQKDIFKGKRVRLGDTTEQSIVIQSTGGANLYFTNYPNSFTFTGDNPGEYIVSKLPPNPLPAGATDTLKLKFVPTVEGARPATVNVLSNAENVQSWPVLLKGIGIIPKIAVDKSLVDADSVAMGQTSCKDITIYNPGSDTLRILKHYFASKDGDYSHTPLPYEPYLIKPNDSVKINICFTPLQKGTRVARFRILTDIPKTMEIPKQDTASIDINFSGNGIPIDRSIIAQKDISDVVVGSEAGTPLEFTNVGTDPVVVAKPIISGTNASEFSISKVNFPLTVAPGASVNMTLMSKPTERGERLANVLFNLTSDGRSYTASTVVKANALLACANSSVTALTFDKLIIGESSANVFEVSNCGDIEQTFTATISGSNAYSVDAASVVVPAGGKANIAVSFAPSVEGITTARLTLTGSHINDIIVNMTGIGQKKPVTQSVGRTTEMNGFVLDQNAPNPAIGYTNISFTSPKMATVHIYLADMTGKLVKEVANGDFSSGSHSVSLDTKDLSSGSYIYILDAGNVHLTRQMVVTK